MEEAFDRPATSGVTEGQPWLNGCCCNPKSGALTHAFITTCVNHLCTTRDPDNIASGTAVYISYCTKVLGAEYTPEAITDVVQTSTTLVGEMIVSTSVPRHYLYTISN